MPAAAAGALSTLGIEFDPMTAVAAADADAGAAVLDEEAEAEIMKRLQALGYVE